MKTVYIVTMWSGGRPAKKWKTEQHPEVLPSGTGMRFTNMESKLSVQVIGSISVEQFESGKEEMETPYWEARPSNLTPGNPDLRLL